MMEKINIFGKTYQVTKQAKYSYYASLIIIAVTLLRAYTSKSKAQPLRLMILIISACLSPYATNCVSQGNCEEYGWYLSISSGALALSLLLKSEARLF